MKFDFKLTKKKIIWIIILLFVTFVIFSIKGLSRCFDCYSQSQLHIIFVYLTNIFAPLVVLLISQDMFSKYYLFSVILTIVLEFIYFYIILSLLYSIFKRRINKQIRYKLFSLLFLLEIEVILLKQKPTVFRIPLKMQDQMFFRAYPLKRVI